MKYSLLSLNAQTLTATSIVYLTTSLLKNISSTIASTVLSIVNLSLSTGSFPTQLESFFIAPLLKKPYLDKDTLSNYRHISNLSVISKITERAVKERLLKQSNSLLNHTKSAYTKHHSTETTLLSLLDHLSNDISHQQVSCLSSRSVCCLWYYWPFIVSPVGLVFPEMLLTGSPRIFLIVFLCLHRLPFLFRLSSFLWYFSRLCPSFYNF